jgi:hypothetical protein
VSTTALIIIIAVATAIVAALAAARGSGPRVTHITRTVEHDDKDGDGKDDDHA